MLDLQRQADIISEDELRRYPVTIIGAGGIGSPLAVVLAKMGVSDLTVYDPDVVELHNLSSQSYRMQDIGTPKVEALAAVCREFAGIEITTHVERFPLDASPRGVVITAVDSMEARKQIWDTAIKLNPVVDCYLEARMGGQDGRVYTISCCDPDDIRRYEATLYSDDEAVELACTARAIGFNTWFLAGLIASQLQKFVMRREIKPEVIFNLASLSLQTPKIEKGGS
jgi:molybdopterin-synthase adenylyltransferase